MNPTSWWLVRYCTSDISSVKLAACAAHFRCPVSLCMYHRQPGKKPSLQSVLEMYFTLPSASMVLG